MTISVAIVEDSSIIRAQLSRVIAQHPGYQITVSAMHPVQALDKMATSWPDVIISDIEMPVMDGLTFLKKIMADQPTPVVICSGVAGRGSRNAVEALSLGAVEIVEKPQGRSNDERTGFENSLMQALDAASRANVAKHVSTPKPIPASLSSLTRPQIIAIGSSTGGCTALETILKDLPADCPPICIVQHLPKRFTASFAKRLNGLCAMEVKEARSGEPVGSGQVFVAPGDQHLTIENRRGRPFTRLTDNSAVSGHKPSATVLFDSIAKNFSGNTMGIILTGMGEDGAAGLFKMHQKGATTLAQDEETCVVYGMPRVAVKIGAVKESLPLPSIAGTIIQSL